MLICILLTVYQLIQTERDIVAVVNRYSTTSAVAALAAAPTVDTFTGGTTSITAAASATAPSFNCTFTVHRFKAAVLVQF